MTTKRQIDIAIDKLLRMSIELNNEHRDVVLNYGKLLFQKTKSSCYRSNEVLLIVEGLS